MRLATTELPPMIEMTLPTMSCEHCVRTIAKTVARVDPAAKVEIDLARQRLRIESARGAAEFVGPLVEEGYPPHPAAG